MDLKNVNPEMLERARACKTPEEMLALAKEEGYELSDEELDQVSGGGWGSEKKTKCPKCGSPNITKYKSYAYVYECLNCHRTFM